MRVKQFQVKVIPKSGPPFYTYIGGHTKSSAYYTASQMYPNETVVIEREV